jgi:hypothetical protein
MGRIYQCIYVASRNFAAETITLFPVFYNSITTSAPVLPTEFINEPASPYSEKEYNKIDENWIPYHAIC